MKYCMKFVLQMVKSVCFGEEFCLDCIDEFIP
jgi:hypothetical protein